MSTAQRAATDLGEISVGSTYPLPLFQRLTGLSVWALRQARRRGLRMKVVGRRKFVTGRDWHDYLESIQDSDDA